MPDDASKGGYFQPDTSDADFAFWAKMPVWTGDEAAALILGFSPSFIVRELRTAGAERHFREYLSMKELAHRAALHKQIAKPLTPVRWVEWAKARNFLFIPELETQVNKWAARLETKDTDSAARIFELESQIAQLTRQADASTVGTRERESMLTLIIAMAVQGYRFDPNAKRGDSVMDIVSDITKSGLSLSDDTVRRYLREASDLLPPQNRDA